MTLRWKMAVQIACMIVGLVMVSAAAMAGLNALHEDYRLSLAGYQDLREVYSQVGLPLATARLHLNTSPASRAMAAQRIESARDQFDVYLQEARRNAEDDPRDFQAEDDLRAALVAAVRQLQSAPPHATPEEVQRADLRSVEAATVQMRSFVTRIEDTITARRNAAEAKRRDTRIALGVLSGGVVLAAIALGILQYRSVMLPLRRLGAGVRKIAGGEFKERLDDRGRDEFARLAREFNQMAGELDEFYHRLEKKVADKSKELIRSERLASVGFLAAGLAHEINNPLGIIAGYAEYSLGQLKSAPPSASGEELSKSLQVIADEAFRCKDIIGKLLSMARPGEANRQEVDLAKVAGDVAQAVAGLRDFRDRTLTVVVAGEPVRVSAVEAEMKQVVLNLALNALQAVPSGGAVRIEVGRTDGWAELRVIDNGRGMDERTLERVFEPFFTDKRGVREPGTGLGLSISHAIIESHGGRITATSAGPGKGSEFVVRLPAATQRSVA